MKVILAALGLLMASPIAFGQGAPCGRLSKDTVAGEGKGKPCRARRSTDDAVFGPGAVCGQRANWIGRERGSLEHPRVVSRVVPVEGTEGLPEGMPWEEKPAEEEGKKAPAEEGEEPTAPPEEVP
ncbi:MAG: hypothetical protein PHO89_11035 [Methylacidiphilaceae bacterium]|nr:hypothetical protein [Candidatus Methylacidiphilaceae bacterium]